MRVRETGGCPIPLSERSEERRSTVCVFLETLSEGVPLEGDLEWRMGSGLELTRLPHLSGG